MADRDVSEKMLNEFFSEAEDIIGKLSADLFGLDESIQNGRMNPDLLNDIFRGSHSLKGISGIFGFDKITDLAHTLETFLDQLRLGKVRFNQAIVDLLFEAVDMLNLTLAEQSGDGDPVDIGAICNRLEKAARGELEEQESAPGSGNGGLEEIDPAIRDVLTEYEEFRLRENIAMGSNLFKIHAVYRLETFDTDLAQTNEDLKAHGEIIATLPSSMPSEDDCIGFDLLFGTERDQQGLEAEFGDRRLEFTPVLLAAAAQPAPAAPAEPAAPRPAPEPSAPPAKPTAPTTPAAAPAPPAEAEHTSIKSLSRVIKVSIDKLDLLMNNVGELLVIKTILNELSSQMRAEYGFSGISVELHKLHRDMERKLRELQAAVMDIRMTPIGQLFDKVQRVVRNASKEIGKEIELITEGGDTEIDKMILEELSDPLVHILRNAIDHGIEAPADRVLAGKPERGTIRLEAEQKGNYCILRISDDGAGIDIDAVRAKAVQSGLIGANESLDRRETLELIFHPGLTTKESASTLSGRGVGMDVVRENIGRLGGMITVETERHKGSTFILSLPITMAIIQALFIRVAERIFAIPLNAIIETIQVRREEIRTIERREVIEFRELTLPLLRLRERFELGESERDQEEFYVVVVGVAERRVGILVEELIAQQDVVIKSIHRMQEVRGIAGATELGNQKTVLVLDVNALLGEAGGEAR